MKHICPLCQSEYEKPEEKAMTDKEKFIKWWTPTVGREEAEKSWEEKQKQPTRMANMVQSDIEGYISQVDGSWISSRSQHRNHLKQHKMIELGNDPITQHKPVEIDRKSQEARKRAIAEATYAKLRYK
jgi:hypothetical protein